MQAVRTCSRLAAVAPWRRPVLPPRAPSRVGRATAPPPAALPPHLFTLLADIDPVTITDAGAASTAAGTNAGWLAPLARVFETFLGALNSGLEAVHVPYSYGFAIILLTLIVKAATFPLTKKQMESTVAIQALQPRVKEIQERYKGRPAEEAQVEVARLYKEAGVNPLAGCLPTLATLPVWIGLYRALSAAADDGLLTSGWFWIPSLAGPTTLAAQKAGSGSAWLFPFVDGAPPIGWHDAGAYLILPILLIVSQSISQRIMSPPSDDPAQQQTQAILKFLPLMIGWFSLNVPSGLTLYWFTNNLLSTAQSVWLKATIQPPAAATAPLGSTTIVKEDVIDVTPSKPTGRDINARRSSSKPSPSVFSGGGASSSSSQLPSGPSSSSRGSKFRALKAKEAAKKAAGQAAASPAAAAEVGGDGVAGGGAAATATGDKPVVPDAPPSKD